MEDKKGFILLARKMISSDIFSKPPLYLKVWIYILSSAYHTESGGIQRGEFKTSIKEIQDACTFYVGYRKEVPTPKQIRSILEYLRKPCERNTKGAMIDTAKVTHGILIKVLNYDVYQNFKLYEGNNEKPTKRLRTDNKGHNKEKALKKEEENIKNKTYSAIVEEFTSNVDLKEALLSFVEMRKKEKTFTTTALKLALVKLDKLAIDDVTKIEMVNQTVLSGWKSFYPLKQNQTEVKQGIVQEFKQEDKEISDKDKQALIDRIKNRGEK